MRCMIIDDPVAGTPLVVPLGSAALPVWLRLYPAYIHPVGPVS
jgi:hypothetical protein